MSSSDLITPSDSVPASQTGHSQVQFLTPPELLVSEGMSVIRGTVEGPGVVPLHSHTAPESFYVLEGQMEAYQEVEGKGSWLPVKKGDYAVIRSDAKHAWRNTTSLPCSVLIFTDAELTAFLQGLCDIETAVSSPEEAVGKALELAAKSRCWLATPEENASIGLKFP